MQREEEVTKWTTTLSNWL